MSLPDDLKITLDKEMIARVYANAVRSAIRDALHDLKTVPSGELYACVMPYVSLDAYETIIDELVRERFITRQAHLLTWIGPSLTWIGPS